MFAKPKYYQDCSHLKMDIFLEILKSNNLSLLCYSGKPKDKELKEIWQNIEAEYEKITGKPEYYRELADNNEECKAITRINALITLFDLMRLNPDKEFKEFQTYWEVEGMDLTELRTTILREQTRYEISKDQELSIKKLKEHNKKPITIEDLKLSVEEWLNKDYIDFSKITVTEWVAMCHRVSEKTKAINDARANKSE